MAPGTQEVLVFEVAGQRFGLPGGLVRELLRAVLITPVPRSQQFVEGVINVRGTIVPVLNLREWLGLPARPVEPADHFVVAWAGERLVALHVDRALELASVDAAAFDQADSIAGVAARVGDFQVQVAKLAGGLVLLPDLRPLFESAPALSRSAPSLEERP